MEQKGKRIQAVEKAVLLMDVLWKERRELSLAELGKLTQMAKSSIHITLMTLMDSSLVTQNPENGKYYLGHHAYELGCAASMPWEILPVAEHHMNRVVEQYGISMYLGKRCGDEIVLIKNVEPNYDVVISSPQGGRIPMYGCAQGKCILAQLPEAELERYLRNFQFKSYTMLPAYNAEELRKELLMIRNQGFSTSQMLRTGTRSVGAPIFDRNGRCEYGLAAVGLSKGPLSIETFTKTRDIVMQTAHGITIELQRPSSWRGY